MKTQKVTSLLERLLRPMPTKEELRRHSPRGNFMVLFDCDDRLQILKRKAHTAADPSEFEEALFEICLEFYEEGHRVAEAAA